MDVDVTRLLRTSHALITTEDAAVTGHSPGDIQQLVRSGRWIRIRRGVFVTAAVWEQFVERDRPLLQALAASAGMRTPHLLSHDSAAVVLDLPLLDPPALVHITRYGAHGGRTTHGVKHHRAPFEPWQARTDAGIAYLGPARTVADLAREHGVRQGIVAFDAAVAAGVPMIDLHAVAGQMRNWPGVSAVKQCLELVDGGSESPGESLTRLLVSELGVGRPETQFGLVIDGRKVWADLRVRRHLIEFDGRAKYLPEDQGGFSGRRPDEVLWLEKLREDALRALRLGISRVVWADLLPHRWRATQARLLAEIAQSDRLYGTTIDDLRPLILPRALRAQRIDHSSRPL